MNQNHNRRSVARYSQMFAISMATVLCGCEGMNAPPQTDQSAAAVTSEDPTRANPAQADPHIAPAAATPEARNPIAQQTPAATAEASEAVGVEAPRNLSSEEKDFVPMDPGGPCECSGVWRKRLECHCYCDGYTCNV